MKHKKWIQCLVHGVLAFTVAFAGCSCLASAFFFEPVDMWQVAAVCALCSGISCLLLSVPRGNWMLFCGLALALGYLLRSGSILSQLEAVLYQISRSYDESYGWGQIWWSGGAPKGVPVTGGLALGGGALSLLISWVLCRRKRVGVAVGMGLLPLLVCMVLPDAVPQTLWLFLLLSSLLVLLLTQPVRRRVPGSGVRAIALAMVPVMLVTGLLLWGNPRMDFSGTITGRPHFLQDLLDWLPMGLNSSTNGTKVQWAPIGAEDLSKVGPQEMPRYAVMDVVTDITGTIYLRGQSLDTYTGTHWRASYSSTGEDVFFPEINMEKQGSLTLSLRRHTGIRYMPYYLKDYGQFELGYIPMPDKVLINTQYTVYAPKEGENLVHRPSVYPSTSQMVQQCLELPNDTQQAAEEALYRWFGEPERNEDARWWAEEIAQHLRRFVPYSLNTPQMPEDEQDFVAWFLEGGTESGYCVHFASAMVVLLRAVRIPARYVTGYTFQSEGGRSTVRAYHVHAWAEYLDPEKGWTVIDATPAAPLPGEELPTEDTDLPVPTQPDTQKETTQAPTQPDTQEETEPFVPDPGVNILDPEEKEEGFAWPWILLPLALAAVAGQYGLRRLLRRRGKKPNKRALRLWQEAEILAKLTRQPAPAPLEELAEKAKFSQHTITDAELKEFNCWILAARKKLKERPFAVRFVLQLIFAV